MKTHKQKRGMWGEQIAESFLVRQGYEILERNYQIKKCELDIVAFKEIKGEKTLCFIEVKTRAYDDGSAERATNYEKLQHLFHGAKEYCLEKNIVLDAVPIQFEQISVYGKSDEEYTMSHYIIPIN